MHPPISRPFPTTWGRGLRLLQCQKRGQGKVRVPRGDPAWRQVLRSRQVWGPAPCQAAIFPAQPVATPHEAPRAGVIVRVPTTAVGGAVKARGAAEGPGGEGDALPAPSRAPAEGMVAQSPVKLLLCSHFLIGGLGGPRSTPGTRERSRGSTAVVLPAAFVAVRLSVWGERRLLAVGRRYGFPPPSQPLSPTHPTPAPGALPTWGRSFCVPQDPDSPTTHPRRTCVQRSQRGNGTRGGPPLLSSCPR